VSHLVYLDAIVPRPGQSLFDDWSETGQQAVAEEARLAGDPRRWPMPDDLDVMSSFDGLTDQDKQWLRTKSAPQPLKTFSQPLPPPKKDSQQLPRSYILCTSDRAQFPEYVETARTSSAWGFYELATGHWPMISKPNDVATILLEIATTV
ncbi:MAG: alpha/beta fold hydrolase, partial [Chloroflexota bacterium]